MKELLKSINFLFNRRTGMVFSAILLLLMVFIFPFWITQSRAYSVPFSFVYIPGLLGIILGLMPMFVDIVKNGGIVNLNAEKIKAAEEKISQDPKNPLPTWELAQAKIEQYIDNNIRQIDSIYFIMVGTMVTGFALIVAGVMLCFFYPNELGPGIVSAASGIFTNFISATFLFVYRSTIQQAGKYVVMLESINSVGMSFKILNSIDEEYKTEKAKALIDLSLKISGGNGKIETKEK